MTRKDGDYIQGDTKVVVSQHAQDRFFEATNGGSSLAKMYKSIREGEELNPVLVGILTGRKQAHSETLYVLDNKARGIWAISNDVAQTFLRLSTAQKQALRPEMLTENVKGKRLLPDKPPYPLEPVPRKKKTIQLKIQRKYLGGVTKWVYGLELLRQLCAASGSNETEMMEYLEQTLGRLPWFGPANRGTTFVSKIGELAVFAALEGKTAFVEILPSISAAITAEPDMQGGFGYTGDNQDELL